MKTFRNRLGAGLALALAGVLAGQAALAQTATPETMDTLSRAIAEAGCSVTMANQQAVAAAAGLSNSQAAAAARALFESGQATIIDGSTLQLLSGPCAGQGAAPEAPELLVAVIGALRANGCAMSQRQGDAILTGLGDRDEIRGHIVDLRESGLARVTNEARVLILSEPLCTANPHQLQTLAANVGALVAAGGEDFAPSRMGAARMLVGRLRETGCTLAPADARNVLEDSEVEAAPVLLHELVGAGVISEGEGFELSKSACKLADEDLVGFLGAYVTGPAE